MWGDGYHDGWQMMDGGGSAFIWGILVLVVVLALAAATVALIMALRQPPGARKTPSIPPESSARRALDERFARGEIDEDEYRRRRSALLET
jgi:putative membrane protein